MPYISKYPIQVNAGRIFIFMLIIVPLIIVTIYLSGKNIHRELYLNALLSTTLFAVLFMILSITGLYRGWKLKDDMVGFKKKIRIGRSAKFTSLMPDEIPDIDGGGIGGFIVSIILGFVLSIVIAALLWFSLEIVWAVLFVSGAVIYAILFRLLQHVFRNTAYCKSQLLNSIKYGIGYTIAYSIPVFILIISGHLLVQALT
jgi:hypothetical protein